MQYLDNRKPPDKKWYNRLLSIPRYLRLQYNLWVFVLVVFLCACNAAYGGIVNWTGGAGNNNWSDVDNWAGGNKKPDTTSEVAKFLDNVGGTANLDQDYTIKQLYLDGGDWTINGSGTLTVMSSGFKFKDGSSFVNVDVILGGSGDHIFDATSNSDWGEITGTISGNGNLVKTGSGELAIDGNNTFTGTVKIQAGTLYVGSDSNLGNASNNIELSGGTLATTANMSTSRDVAVSGTSTIDTGTTDGNNLTLNGVVSGATGTLTKSGTTTLTLAGTSANTYTGNIVVSEGTLQLSKTAGIDAVGGGNVTVDSGATLLLNAANQINDGAGLTLGGGIFNTGGYSEELGALTLTADSIIDMGDGASILTFASISGLDSYTLTIRNWDGYYFGDGTDQLHFTDTSGLVGHLDNVIFEGYEHSSASQVIDGSEVAPTPEPSTVIGGAMMLSLLALKEFNRRKKLKTGV